MRIPAGCPLTAADLPETVDTVLLADPRSYAAPGPYGAAGPDAVPVPDTAPAPDTAASPYADPARDPAPGRPEEWADGGRRRVWAEVTTPEEAAAACAAGVTAVVARGHESGGRVGELTTCVLLQRLLADPAVTVPVLAAGGIGPHTAAAAVAGGAAGVLLDSQLALTTEGEDRLPRAVAAAIRAMDGSETTVVAGHRVLTRPDLRPSDAGDGAGGGDETGERRPATPPIPPPSPPAWAPGTCGPSCSPSARTVPSPPGWPRATGPPAASCRPYGPPSPAISTPRRATVRSPPPRRPPSRRGPGADDPGQ